MQNENFIKNLLKILRCDSRVLKQAWGLSKHGVLYDTACRSHAYEAISCYSFQKEVHKFLALSFSSKFLTISTWANLFTGTEL